MSTGSQPPPPVWSPSPNDFRFQGVGAGISTASSFNINMNGGVAESYGNQWGSPLELGNGICGAPGFGYQDCSWFLNIHQYAPASVRDTAATYVSGALTDLSSFPNLGGGYKDLSKNNPVVRSLDVQPANNGYALAYISSSSVTAGFVPSLQHMEVSNLQAFATGEGLQGRAVTALSLDSPTTCYVFSYGWANDTNSVYEASVAPVSIDTVGSVAQNMASQGYVLTAFGAGGNPTFGWYLIGTRLQGSTTPRPIFVSSPGRPSDALYYSQAYVDVVTIFDAPTPATATRIWVVEK